MALSYTEDTHPNDGDIHYLFLKEVADLLTVDYADTPIALFLDFFVDQYALRITLPLPANRKLYSCGAAVHSLHSFRDQLVISGCELNSRFRSPHPRTHPTIPGDLLRYNLFAPDAFDVVVTKLKWIIDKTRKRDGW